MTKKLLKQYGAKLFGVRYRCDPEQRRCIKTVELIIEESEYKPRPRRIKDDQLVGIHVDFREFAPQRQVKSAGGRWGPNARLRELRYDQVVKLGLTERIEKKKVSNTRNRP